MTGYRGFVPGPNGEQLAPTRVSVEEMAASREAEQARVEKAVEAHAALEASARAERERIDAEHGTLELEDYHDRARSAWLGNGGTAADFTDSWPELRRRYLTEKTAEGLTAFDRTVEVEKAALRRSGRYGPM